MEQTERLGRELASGRIAALRVVARPPSWGLRAFLLGLPPLLLALGLGLLLHGPLPLGPLGWGITLGALVLGGGAFLRLPAGEIHYELWAVCGTRAVLLFQHASRAAVEDARCALLRAALVRRTAPKRRRA